MTAQQERRKPVYREIVICSNCEREMLRAETAGTEPPFVCDDCRAAMDRAAHVPSK